MSCEEAAGGRAALVLVLVLWPAIVFAEVASQPGIVDSRPASGPVVKTADGYLIPYSQPIPGSDVEVAMVPVPGGTFLIGSPADEADRADDEGPQVRISLPPFWIGQYEVTWGQYKQYMQLTNVFEKFDDQGLRPITSDRLFDAITAPSKLYDPSFTFQSGEEADLPAVTMSQYAARQFTKWLSLLSGPFYRLPTEAEWEHACRAGTSTAYSFGDDPTQLAEYAWHYENSDDATHPVGQKLPNAWGIYDMHGNAREWVLDGYQADRYEELAAQAANGQSELLDDPVNWATQLYPRVLRGGSWNDDPPLLRSAARYQSHDDDWRDYDPNSPKSPWWFASDTSQDVGFRIVRPWQPPTPDKRSKFWDAEIPEIQKVVDSRIDEEGRGKRGLVDPELPAAIAGLHERATGGKP